MRHPCEHAGRARAAADALMDCALTFLSEWMPAIAVAAAIITTVIVLSGCSIAVISKDCEGMHLLRIGTPASCPQQQDKLAGPAPSEPGRGAQATSDAPAPLQAKDAPISEIAAPMNRTCTCTLAFCMGDLPCNECKCSDGSVHQTW